ncbi:MAG: recombinase family protein [Cellulomonas sp.]
MVIDDEVLKRHGLRHRPATVRGRWLDRLRPDAGDTLVVWRLDRLGRSVKDLLTVADDLHSRGIGLRILTGTPAGGTRQRGRGGSRSG